MISYISVLHVEHETNTVHKVVNHKLVFFVL